MLIGYILHPIFPHPSPNERHFLFSCVALMASLRSFAYLSRFTDLRLESGDRIHELNIERKPVLALKHHLSFVGMQRH